MQAECEPAQQNVEKCSQEAENTDFTKGILCLTNGESSHSDKNVFITFYFL